MFYSVIAMAPQQGAQPNALSSMIPFFAIFFAIFYFLIIRPQQKRQRQFQDMINSLKEHDKVVTSGGIHGIITGIKEVTVILKIADNVKIEVNKSNIAQITTEKTDKVSEKK